MQARNMILIAIATALAGSASTAFAAPDDQQARENWKEIVSHTPTPEDGCFHANYPSTQWVKDACVETPHRYMAPPHRSTTGELEIVGNGNDDSIGVAGLIKQTVGTFPSVTGVTFEKGVAVSAFGSGGILGKNEYTLQINANLDRTTAACNGHTGCTIWQQFIYAPDYDVKGTAAVFIESWLIGYGGTTCPSGFDSDDQGDCVTNSQYVPAPDLPIKDLANEKLSGSATAGGNDTVVFNNGSTAYSLSAKDSVVDLATVWHTAEFNVVGNAGGSRASFNKGSSITVKVAVNDGSKAVPTCVRNGGETGETNNLTLGNCTAAGGATPSIQFVESN